jgi:hypothetical protein
VVAAPIAARPDTPKPSSNDRFIVRVCAWPAQRPQRPTCAPVRQVRPGGGRRDEGSGFIPGHRDRPAGALSGTGLSRLGPLVTRNRSGVRLSDCPRC